ncbi:hypothetical protein C8J56DRAFT_497785 [Mycena floridula]|nr:hypothetical protein C8J56DRAFT_497785 [Mycena floridula]
MLIHDLPEELIQEIVPLLVDDEYKSYPDSLHHTASKALCALSLTNRQFRRISLPSLFSYIRCTTLEELAQLEHECINKSGFTGFIRTLDVAFTTSEQASTLDSLLVRLLPRLDSLLWIELHQTITISLITAINDHPTLKTLALPYIQAIPEPIPQTVPLDKVLIHYSTHDSSALSSVEQHNVRVEHLHLAANAVCFRLESMIIRELRALSITDSTQVSVDLLHAFVAHHSNLTKITIDCHSFWEEANFSKQHISSFLDTVERQGLRHSIGHFNLSLSPLEFSSRTKFDGWKVTELEFIFASSAIEMLSLAGRVFPNVVSLFVKLPIPDSPIRIEVLAALISKDFLNLRILKLYDKRPGFITWTPALSPVFMEFPNEPFEDAAACIRTLAWLIFQASVSMIHIQVGIGSQGLDALRTWTLSAVYNPQRDLTGAIVKMKIQSKVYIVKRRANGLGPLTFRGSVGIEDIIQG